MMLSILAAGSAGGDECVPTTLSTLLMLLVSRPRLWSRLSNGGAPDPASAHIHARNDHSPAVSALLTADGRVVSLSPNAGQLLGSVTPPSVGVGCSLADLMGGASPEDEASLLAAVRDVRPGQSDRRLVSRGHAEGGDETLEVWFKNLHEDPAVGGMLVEVRRAPSPAPAAGAARTGAADRSLVDPLTGLRELRLLREQARLMLALARRRGNLAALLRVGIDGIATAGHAGGADAGRELLRTVGERLAGSLRESDTLARADEHEFVILLSEVRDEDAAARVVLRLRDSLARPCHVHGQQVCLGVHIGVAIYPQDATTFDELMEDAAQALARATGSGSGFEFFRREQSAVTHDRIDLEEDLRWAWEHDQFVLHYQPILGADSGEVVGVEALTRGTVSGMEALARWPHARRGMISPAEFIPLAERTGRIVSLDRWAIATAARQAAAWAREGWDGWVSVNLSARSLHDPDLPGYVGRTLRSHGLARERVVLEITESTAMRNPDVTAEVLRRLRETGVLVAVDDFGIGHSSLAYLKHFPVDLLKLDRTFVAEVGSGSRNDELVRLIIDLAHHIGARVVAEGVEREEQHHWLEAAGCDFIQGFLIGHPAPPERVPTRAA